MPNISTAQVSRRSVAKGLAWSVPAVTIAAAAPAMAASGCTTYTTSISGGSTNQTTATFSATAADSTPVTVTVTSSATSCTTFKSTPANLDYNMTIGTTIQQGGYSPNVCGVGTSSGSSAGLNSTGLVLNQAASYTYSSMSSCSITAGCTSPAQTLIFTFTKDGKTVNAKNLSMVIADISSVNDMTTMSNYYDAVSFGGATVTKTSSTKGALIGDGSDGNSYRRSSANLASSDGPFSDTFTFSTFSSGSTMTYSDYGLSGWQYIAITGLTFDIC